MNLEGEKGVMKLYYNLIFFKKKICLPTHFLKEQSKYTCL